MVAEEVIVTLSGGAPWGFRLQGGVEHQKPLQVAKVRKRSKACRAGLREADELLSINEQPCGGLSHAQAMELIDSSTGMLHIRVKRAPAGFQSVVLLTRAPSPRIDKEYRAAMRTMSPPSCHHAPVREIHCSRSSLGSGLTSPPGSEAYYGETDSDADVAGYERQRRQKRRSPSNSTPGKLTGRVSPEGGETSEMSGYDSAPDARAYPSLLEGRGGGGEGLPGVARREVIYQPPAPGMWSSQTSTETSSIISSEDQGPREGGLEEDSGFQELANVPLVSPERAKEAMMLSSRSQMVPMVGPVDRPVDEELSTTYVEKAKQAKLNRGDTVSDKQVKEAKVKCRTIASLLTDAPNPHSKGVLMFKKRRQRSKKYTLTSFGSVDEDMYQDSQEEDGMFPGSESEFDEEGFSAVPDPTWDSDFLDMLDKRAAADVGSRGDGAEDAPSPGLSDTTGKGAQLFEQARKRAAEHAKKVEAAQAQAPPQSQVLGQPDMHHQSQILGQPDMHHQSQILGQPEMYHQSYMQPDTQLNLQPHPLLAPPPAGFQDETPAPTAAPAHSMASGDLAYSAISTASMMMSPPTAAPKPASASVTILSNPAPPPQTPLPELPASNVVNRTARPFAAGRIANRSATAPVVFRPAVTKKPQRPSTSAAVGAPAFFTSSELSANFTPIPSQLPSGPQPMFPQHFSVSGGPNTPAFMEHMQVAPPITAVSMPSMAPVPMPLPPQAQMAPVPAAPILQAPVPATIVPLAPAYPVQVPVAQPHSPQVSIAPVSVISQAVAPTPVPGPTGRTGILLDSRRRNYNPKPMFQMPDAKKNSPNPALLSMVQNLDERPAQYGYGCPASEAYDDVTEEDADAGRGRMPPPVAPKPRVFHEAPQIPHAEGKGAQLFARRQSRMGMYVVDTPPETPYQQELHSSAEHRAPSPNPSLASQWKYSPNIRAPPPIGYNPLLAPTVPVGPQRDTVRADSRFKGGMAPQREGIKAVEAMRRQPYQLNSAMFSYGGSVANLSAMPSYQAQRQQQGGYTPMVGSSLTQPRQIPVKAARVFEIKRFSTPTPMSAPTLVPKVIAPRSATTLGDRITRSDMCSPPPAPLSPLSAPTPVLASARVPTQAFTSAPVHVPSYPIGLPSLPKISATPIPNLVPNVHPTPYTPSSYNTGFQAAKQFQSAPELSILASLPPLRPNPVQVPKPRFVATKGGIQPRIWRPGAM